MISLLVSILAFRKSLQTDARDRTATIVIEPVWSEKHNTYTWIPRDSDEQRPKADQYLVIACMPAVADGLTLRPPTQTEDNDQDLMGYNSHRIELSFQNVGRSAASDVRFLCTLTGTFLVRFAAGTEHRAFSGIALEIPTVAPGETRTVQIRSMPSIPVTLHIDSVQTNDPKQPVTIAGRRSFDFHPRG